MAQKKRYLKEKIFEDLNKKMVLLEVLVRLEKQLLIKQLFKKFSTSNYYNWDFQLDKKNILSKLFPAENGFLIFDEIHKYKKWKNLIKGIYYIHKEKYRIFVTLSARLNVYRKSGDSLQGRYHYYTLHPFSLAEIENL